VQQLCRQRLNAFREQPDQRLGEIEDSPMRPGPLRVLRRAAVAQQSTHQRALEVDHIVQKNQGGSDAITNLQALCIADADLVIEGHAMSFESCAPRAMGSCQVQR
jgi:hypothetical protein